MCSNRQQQKQTQGTTCLKKGKSNMNNATITSKTAKWTIIKRLLHSMKKSTLIMISLALPCSLMAGPIVVRISDLRYPNPPEVEVDGAPQGWNFCSCADLGVIDPANEDGGLITLFGVDRGGSINEPNECGWRFIDPKLPQPTCASAVDIVWIQHDYSGPFLQGDLQIGFNSALPGHYYRNPTVCPGCDVSLGPLNYKWQTVYADATVVVLFKAQK
jgi:hypothetical protein